MVPLRQRRALPPAQAPLLRLPDTLPLGSRRLISRQGRPRRLLLRVYRAASLGFYLQWLRPYELEGIPLFPRILIERLQSLPLLPELWLPPTAPMLYLPSLAFILTMVAPRRRLLPAMPLLQPSPELLQVGGLRHLPRGPTGTRAQQRRPTQAW